MLNSTERAALRSLATELKPVLQVGKGGITDNFLSDLNAALDAHELVKISVLRTSEEDAKTLLARLSDATDAEQITAIGSKVVLYRRSEKKGVKHIEF